MSKRNIVISISLVIAIVAAMLIFSTQSGNQLLGYMMQRVSRPRVPAKMQIPAAKPAAKTILVNPTVQQRLSIAVCKIQWDNNYVMPSNVDLQKEIDKTKDWLKKTSYGQAVIDSFQIVEANANGQLPATIEEENKIAQKICDPLIDFSKTNIMIMTPKSASWGAGNAGIQEWSTEEGVKKIYIIKISHYELQSGFVDNFVASVLAHELGHAITTSDFPQDNNLNIGGLSHSNAWNCGAKSFSATAGECISEEYGHPFDVMGSGGYYSLGDINGFYKYLIKWLTPEEVNTDGTYQLGVLEGSLSKYPQLIRIPYSRYPVCMEFRKPIGLDEELLQDNLSKKISLLLGKQIDVVGIPKDGCLFVSTCENVSPNPNDPQGISLQLSKLSNLIDTTPDSIPDNAGHYDFYDACLKTGVTFTNADLGLTVSYQPSMDGKYADVKISDIQKNRIETKSNLSTTGTRYISWPPCIQNSKQGFGFSNSSEKNITEPFDISVTGFTKNATQTIIEQRPVQQMKAGDSMELTYDYNLLSQYINLRLSLDTQNTIVEGDESDNTYTMSGCQK